MSAERQYPETPSGPFPEPPRTIVDDEDREITLTVGDDDDLGALRSMYDDFDPKDRAQGIPPIDDHALDRWLGQITRPDCYGVVATYGEEAVGHAILVPDEAGTHELAIFVNSPYQSAGIGTELVETLLGLAATEGLERVWLTVERWNEAAIALYRKVGFEVCSSESFEMEMSIRLD